MAGYRHKSKIKAKKKEANRESKINAKNANGQIQCFPFVPFSFFSFLHV
jgi:hypothetical protein